MKRLSVAVVAAWVVLATTVVPAAAAPLHQHFITTPSGQVISLAPSFCLMPAIFGEGAQAHIALENLHQHFHMGAPVEIAFVNNPIFFSFLLPCP